MTTVADPRELEEEEEEDGCKGAALKLVREMVAMVDKAFETREQKTCVFPPISGKAGYHLDGKARVLFLKLIKESGYCHKPLKATEPEKKKYATDGESIPKCDRHWRVVSRTEKQASNFLDLLKQDRKDAEEEVGAVLLRHSLTH